MREKIIQKVKDKKIIVIVRKVYGEDCKKLVKALSDGGIELVEFTFDQDAPEDWMHTCENISMVCRDFGKEMSCGAGTVLMKQQVWMAKRAGADFIVSPNVSREVIEETVQQGMVSMPGAMTPTEVVDAAGYGADFVKLFPAALFGTEYLKAICGPINHIPLLAVGGINEKNIGGFLETGAKGAGVGGDLVNKSWIRNGEFEKITQMAKALVRNSRGDGVE